MNAFLAGLFLLIPIFLNAQNDLKGYQFYSGKKPVKYKNVVEELAQADVVLFGEYHDHAMVHWLQLKLFESLMAERNIVLGGEFFETDDQLLLDELISGITPMKKFKAEAKLWPNYETDYLPILQLAVDSGLKFVATNVPRRYASLVARYGSDTLSYLSKDALNLLPPLPMPFSFETPGYMEMKEMMSGGHGMGMTPENMVKAQALKDYTMAYNISVNLEGDALFFHINGDFHSADFGGIFWYLNQLNPDLRVKTIKVEQAAAVDKFDEEWEGRGDFILVVPADFTRTH